MRTLKSHVINLSFFFLNACFKKTLLITREFMPCFQFTSCYDFTKVCKLPPHTRPIVGYIACTPKSVLKFPAGCLHIGFKTKSMQVLETNFENFSTYSLTCE